MIRFTQKPKRVEESDIKALIDEIVDIYSDFYITKNNLRLMIKDNKDLFFECLNKGDRIIWEENKGILFVTGISDNADRLYVRPLCKDNKTANKLIKNLNWAMPDFELWIKLKRKNPVLKVFLKESNHYKYVKPRGKEILLCRPKLDIKKEN